MTGDVGLETDRKDGRIGGPAMVSTRADQRAALDSHPVRMRAMLDEVDAVLVRALERGLPPSADIDVTTARELLQGLCLELLPVVDAARTLTLAHFDLATALEERKNRSDGK